MQVFGRRWEIRWKKMGLEQETKWKEVGKETRRQNNIVRRERGKQKLTFTVREGEAEDWRMTIEVGSVEQKKDRDVGQWSRDWYSAAHKKLRFRNICRYVTRAGIWALSCSYLPAAAATVFSFTVPASDPIPLRLFLHYLYIIFSFIHDPTVAIYILYIFLSIYISCYRTC